VRKISLKKKKKTSAGVSLIELIFYASLLGIILTVLYLYFIQTSNQKINQIVETAIYDNASRVLFDLQQTIKQASAVDLPPKGQVANSLSLNSGEIIYAVDEQKTLEKTQNGETNQLTDKEVLIEDLTFGNLGPDTNYPTIQINFALKNAHELVGKEKKMKFQTAITLR
jgi:lipopolysaccharide export LptBFGC system permease protein LptF